MRAFRHPQRRCCAPGRPIGPNVPYCWRPAIPSRQESPGGGSVMANKRRVYVWSQSDSDAVAQGEQPGHPGQDVASWTSRWPLLESDEVIFHFNGPAVSLPDGVGEASITLRGVIVLPPKDVKEE